MNNTLTFVTLSGELKARQEDDGIVLDLPLYSAYPQDFHEVKDLIKKLEEDMHQKIAREMNLSETAFIRKLRPTDNFTQSSCFGLRWFTPASEAPLCGHATLASAAVLFQKIRDLAFLWRGAHKAE